MGDADRGGPLLFARYAYPPNQLGYCGPADGGGLPELLAQAQEAGDFAARARRFPGAWFYLRMIAEAHGIADPLTTEVVEAYWIGNALLEQFRGETLPHHSFHVFAVYPWLGVLRSGRVEEPLRVLDQCRIRWGQVEEIRGDRAVVRSRPLVWDGGQLGYGAPGVETVTWAADGVGMAEGLRAGEWVSMHWSWVCDRLDERQRDRLARFSDLTMAAVNRAGRPTQVTAAG